MSDENTLGNLVKDVITLAKSEARGNPAKLLLSPETAALLSSIGEAGTVSEQQETATEDAGAAAVRQTETPEAGTTEKASPDRQKESEQEADGLYEKEKFVEESAAYDNQENDRAEAEEKDSLENVATEVAQCARCSLGESRNSPVPGEGHPKASLVFVGEAPGAEEDRQGRPFVGRAGRLLTDIIVKGMILSRDDVFICNVLKCRPPGNRKPTPEEVVQCEPYLLRQLDLIQPKVICALGATAAQTLLKTTQPIKALRGVWHNYHNIPLRVTYHPAYLLRNEKDKRKTWEDVKEIMRVLDGAVIPEI